MIKDLVVNLTEGDRDVAGPYAISIAEMFDAHVTAIAFNYDPIIPPTVMGGIPASLIEEQRADNEKSARDAVGKFEAGAKRAGISFDARMMSASIAGHRSAPRGQVGSKRSGASGGRASPRPAR